MTRAIHACLCAALCALAPTVTDAQGDLWKKFAHPDSPHHFTGPKLGFPELFENGEQTVDVPTLVILLDYADRPSQNPAQHTAQFYNDLFFGHGEGDYSAARASVTEVIEENTDGKVRLVPATETHGANTDGIVGWVTAQCPCDVQDPDGCGASYYWGGTVYTNDASYRRAEAVRRADPFINYSAYDDDGNGKITSEELVILVVSATTGYCDYHAPDHGNTKGDGASPAGGCKGESATVRSSFPNNVPVDCPEQAQDCCDGGPTTVSMVMASANEGCGADTWAHELGHTALGLPDQYSNEPKGGWVDFEDVEHPDKDFFRWTMVASPAQSMQYIFQPLIWGLPHNDSPSMAIELSDGDRVTGYSVGALGGDLQDCSFGEGADVWFLYRPSVSEPVALDTLPPGCDADTDLIAPVLSVYLQDPATLGPMGQPIACAQDSFPGQPAPCAPQAELSFDAQAGTPYLIRVSSENGVGGRYTLEIGGGRGSGNAAQQATTYSPSPPERHSLMSNHNGTERILHTDPWSKIHIGSVRPQVATHDGWYTLHRTTQARTHQQQLLEPEALIVYDPLNTDTGTPEQHYFILENRHVDTNVAGTPAMLIDTGLAFWLAEETPPSIGWEAEGRQNLSLRRRGGSYSVIGDAGFEKYTYMHDTTALFDGSEADVYDIGPSSFPVNSMWMNGTPSHVRIRDIPPAGEAMSFYVQLTPLWVTTPPAGQAPGAGMGSVVDPFESLVHATAAVANQDLDGDGVMDGSRTLSLDAGTYTEAGAGVVTISTPCSITTTNGAALIR